MAIEICISFVLFLKSLFEELIDFLSGIGIFAVVNSLSALIAVGLDAARIAFSKSKIEKKAVSATAAAVVGVGLLCSPIESAQAQSSNPAPPTVSSVTLTSEEASDYELNSGGFTVSVRLDLGGSGWCVYRPGTGICSVPLLEAYCTDLQTVNSSSINVDSATYGLSFNFSKTFSTHVGGGYYVVDMWPFGYSSSSWIELWIYVNPLTGDVDAWVEDDSAGSYYSVSISVN